MGHRHRAVSSHRGDAAGVGNGALRQVTRTARCKSQLRLAPLGNVLQVSEDIRDMLV